MWNVRTWPRCPWVWLQPSLQWALFPPQDGLSIYNDAFWLLLLMFYRTMPPCWMWKQWGSDDSDWLKESLMRFLSLAGWAEWQLICSVQLLSTRAGPTSCPNALPDNKDPSVRRGEEGARTAAHRTHRTDWIKHRRKMFFRASTPSHMTGRLNVKASFSWETNEPNMRLKEQWQSSVQHQSPVSPKMTNIRWFYVL